MSKDSLRLLYKKEELKDEVLKHFKNRIDENQVMTDIVEFNFHRSDTVTGNIVYSDDKFILDNKITISLLDVVGYVVKELEKDKNHIWY